VPFEYLAVYEVEGEPDDLVQAMLEWSKSERSTGLSPTVAPGFVGVIYEAIGEVVSKAQH
jgi:hypothetical protein